MKREPREQWLNDKALNEACAPFITTEDKSGVEGWVRDNQLMGAIKWRHTEEINKILHASLDELGVPPGRLVDGDLGPIYGKQWTAWEDTKIINSGELEKYQRRGYEVMGLLDDTGMKGEMIQDRYVVNRKINQIQNAIDLLKTSPDSRRIIVSAWNPADIEEQALPACHTLFEFWQREMNFAEIVSMLKHRGLYNHMESALLGAGSSFSGLHYGYEGDHDRHEDFMALVWAWLIDNQLPTRTLSLLFFCRSQDLMVGTPYNLAAYSMLLHMFAEQVNMATDELIWVAGDHHLYRNHLDQVEKQLKRQPIPDSHPTIRFNRKPASIFDYTIEDVDVLNYQHLSRIFLPVAE
jgi:thymidylate synthase